MVTSHNVTLVTDILYSYRKTNSLSTVKVVEKCQVRHISTNSSLISGFGEANHPLNLEYIGTVNHPSKSLNTISEVLTQWQTN